ncbi:MAG: hypothetical protein K2G23_01825 [Muribaculaceae bacterium]|nr:hypothetical protein [Muribaculaceae bacterium]
MTSPKDPQGVMNGMIERQPVTSKTAERFHLRVTEGSGKACTLGATYVTQLSAGGGEP